MIWKQMHDREEGCTPIVFVAVMMHVIIREACQHILKTAPVPQNVLLTDPLYAGIPLTTLCVNLGGVWESKCQAGSRGGKVEGGYLLFRSCIGKLANRPMTSSILQCHRPANSVKKLNPPDWKDLPNYIHSILPTSWMLQQLPF
jgi:hypothetical protein